MTGHNMPAYSSTHQRQPMNWNELLGAGTSLAHSLI
jgi:hypothetical protein